MYRDGINSEMLEIHAVMYSIYDFRSAEAYRYGYRNEGPSQPMIQDQKPPEHGPYSANKRPRLSIDPHARPELSQPLKIDTGLEPKKVNEQLPTVKVKYT